MGLDEEIQARLVRGRDRLEGRARSEDAMWQRMDEDHSCEKCLP